MKIRAVLTDLDGTLLEPGGWVRAEALAALVRLRDAGVPVLPVTSKTPAELQAVMLALGLEGPAGFENGAGVLRADGSVVFHPAAVPVATLRAALADMRRAAHLACPSVEELGERELAAVTGMAGEALARVRSRLATLPLLVAPEEEDALGRALPTAPALRLVCGGRFVHLQGAHDKADIVPRLLAELDVRDGVLVAFGDAANDAELLAVADFAVVVPDALGPSPGLLERRPDAVVAPFPHGRGWAAVAGRLQSGNSRAPLGA